MVSSIPLIVVLIGIICIAFCALWIAFSDGYFINGNREKQRTLCLLGLVIALLGLCLMVYTPLMP